MKAVLSMLARLALAPAAMVAVCAAAIPRHGTATPRQVAAICGAFTAAIRRNCDCDSNPRNELAADVAEKYVIAVEVFPDSAARIQYTKPSERRQQ